MNILVTGATGFIGSALMQKLVSGEDRVRIAVRNPIKDLDSRIEQIQISGLTAQQDWTEALKNIHTVVHCAARVHVMNETAASPLSEFREVNVKGTHQLARQAAEAGVKRLVFLSSIKVNGERTRIGAPFRSSDIPHPIDPYGISKHEAEQTVHQICYDTKMESVIIRPVLVYGPGVKANFRRLIRIAKSGYPLPLGNIRNKRSLVSLDNLVDLLNVCTKHPNAANQTFLVSDGHDLSTSELLRELSLCLGEKPRLFPFPQSVLAQVARLLGKQALIERLFGCLQVDINHTQKRLNWKPPFSTRDSLQKTIDSA